MVSTLSSRPRRAAPRRAVRAGRMRAFAFNSDPGETELTCMPVEPFQGVPGVGSWSSAGVARSERRQPPRGWASACATAGCEHDLCGDDASSVTVTVRDDAPLLMEKGVSSGVGVLAADPASRPDLWRLQVAVALALFFMVVEAVGGLAADSLAVLSDAFHLGLDVASYALALVAVRYSLAPGTATHTFGNRRADVLGSLGSILMLWVLNLGLLAEASGRLVDVAVAYFSSGRSGDVSGGETNQDGDASAAAADDWLASLEEGPDGRVMMSVAAVGVVVNLILVSVLGGRDFGQTHLHSHGGGAPCGHSHGGSLDALSDSSPPHNAHASGSLLAAYLHAFVDLLSCVTVFFVGVVAWWSPGAGAWADPVATMVFVFVAFKATAPVASRAARVLMEATPEGVDADALRIALESVDDRKQLAVRDVHCWSLSMTEAAASARATVARRLDPDEHRRMLRRAEAAFAKAGIAHATVQIEGEACGDGSECRVGERFPCQAHAPGWEDASKTCYKFE